MKFTKLIQIFTVLMSAFFLMSCETANIADGQGTTSVEKQGRQIADYILGPGDKVKVAIFGEENLSGEFLVDGGGSISMPLVGEIQAKGKTLREFQRSVEAELKRGYLKDPRVSAEVLNYRPYYILGEVVTSGEYPFSDGLTVVNAVATAGGFTYRANKKIILIKRAGDFNEIQYPLTTTTPVQPGDTIRVAERLF